MLTKKKRRMYCLFIINITGHYIESKTCRKENNKSDKETLVYIKTNNK